MRCTARTAGGGQRKAGSVTFETTKLLWHHHARRAMADFEALEGADATGDGGEHEPAVQIQQ